MRKILLSLLVSITIPLNITAQEVSINKIDKLETDTVWLNNMQKECNKDTATYCRIIKIDNSLNYTVNDYYLTGELYMTGIFTSLKPVVREGVFNWYYKSGQKKKMSTYENRIRIKIKNWDIDGNEIKPEKDVTEKIPEFPKGEKALMEFIVRNMRYPEAAKYKNEQGRVIVRYIVDENGDVKDAAVLKGVSPSLDAEALRVVKLMPKWKPAISEGEPVRFLYTLPLVFRMTGSKNVDNPIVIRNGQSKFTY